MTAVHTESTVTESTLHFRMRFVDGEAPGVKLSATESRDCSLGFCIIWHLNEAKSTRTSGFTIRHDADTFDLSVGFKHESNGLFRRPKTEVSYEDLHYSLF